jgi:hypothetical protein
MEARLGKRIATGRLLDPARGRAVAVAPPHGVPLGSAPGLQSVNRLRAADPGLLAADALMFAAVTAFREGEAPWT